MSENRAFTAAMVQMRTGLLPGPSLEQATKLIRQAAANGADYVQTPEVSNMMQLNRKALFEHLQSEEDDSSLKAYRALAAELKIHLHVGSLALRFSPEKAVNRSFLIGPEGNVLASYDKIHMFDIELPDGESYRESANYQPGETAVISDLPWGRVGLTICYDVRFPALYRALAESGAYFITVPSAFTRKTGEAHWHVLLRARAIETGCFILAAAQAGTHENKRETYGHSLIIDPWGEILAEGDVEPGVIMARIDPAKVEKAIMAPRIVGKKGRGRATPPPEPAAAPTPEAAPSGPTSLLMAQEKELRTKLKELRDHIVKNADNVGERFANEARAMHYGDKEHRPIYGEASPEEAKSLIDEGIEVSPLPTLPEDRN